MSVISKKVDTNDGVRKVVLTTYPELHPLSQAPNAAQNYYCLAFDMKGFQYQVDLQAMPPGVTIDQLAPNQVWWVEKRTSLYRLYLYAGLQDPSTLQIDSTASLPALQNITTYSGTYVNPILTSAYETVAFNPGVSLSGIVNPVIMNTASGSFYYYPTAPTGQYSIAITGMPTMQGQSATFALLVANGPAAYLPSSIVINGVPASSGGLPAQGSTYNNITTYYQGGYVWTSADPNTVDSYTFTVICTSSKPTYAVFAGLTKF